MSLFDGDVVVLNDDLQSRIYDRCLYMLRSAMCTFPGFDVCAYSLMDQLCCVCFKSRDTCLFVYLIMHMSHFKLEGS